jgi:hypothetical protein
MRHLISIVLGVILAPAIYVLAGIANIKELDHTQHGAGITTLLLGIGCAVAAGALYAILLLVRLSPVGTVLAGLILLAPPIWAAVNSTNFSDTLPASLFGMNGLLQSAAGMGFIVAAIPLLCTVFSPRRWRSSAEGTDASAFDAAPTYGTASSTASPAYQPAGSYTPSYSSTTPTYVPPSYSSSYSPSDTTITSPTYPTDGS